MQQRKCISHQTLVFFIALKQNFYLKKTGFFITGKGEKMNKVISACGIDCFQCEAYLATQNDDRERKVDIAKRWSEQYQGKIQPEDINCDGCMSEGAKFSWCGLCPIRLCVIENGYKSCAECPDFPCDKNEYVYQVNPSAKENIERMR